MPPKGAARWALAFAWTFVPIYATEKLADYYFLTDNTSSFYFMSGWRLILFIAFALCGSLGAGMLLKDVWKAAATQWAALAATMLLFFTFCDQRVCFSSGPGGLEPLRLGFFLGSVAFAGGSLGTAVRRVDSTRSAQVLGGFFGFAAVCFYPVIFTFAGADLIPSLFPGAILLVLALAAFSLCDGAALTVGPVKGFFIPLASLAALLALSAGVAAAYLQAMAPTAVAMTMVTGSASALGALAARSGRRPAAHRGKAWLALAAAVVVVVAGTVFVVPDAVNGVVPSPGGMGSSFVIGTPVYAGAFMDAPPGHAQGAGVTVSFAGTNATSIPVDDYLAAGMGVHSAGCCVDGIDYSYRFDAFLFHGGEESLVASAWEVCDDNAACGGHSWKVLMFLDAEPIREPNPASALNLRMTWEPGRSAHGVAWSYSTGSGSALNFTSFAAPAAENPSFNTGVLGGGTVGGQQNASYFFQFGVMSRYPIGRPGWSVFISCPSVLSGHWECIDHAETLDGSLSYWKVFWRWGGHYRDISVTGTPTDAVRFAFSTATTPSFQPLW